MIRITAQPCKACEPNAIMALRNWNLDRLYIKYIPLLLDIQEPDQCPAKTPKP